MVFLPMVTEVTKIGTEPCEMGTLISFASSHHEGRLRPWSTNLIGVTRLSYYQVSGSKIDTAREFPIAYHRTTHMSRDSPDVQREIVISSPGLRLTSRVVYMKLKMQGWYHRSRILRCPAVLELSVLLARAHFPVKTSVFN